MSGSIEPVESNLDEWVYCFICGANHARADCNIEHIIPYSVGGRGVVTHVGKKCNNLLNSIFDNKFASLDDILINRSKFANKDRNGKVAPPKLTGERSQGGIVTKYRIDVKGGQVVANPIHFPQKLYGVGEPIFASNEELNKETLTSFRG